MLPAVQNFGNCVVHFATRLLGCPTRFDTAMQELCHSNLNRGQIRRALSNASQIKHTYTADQVYLKTVHKNPAHPAILNAAYAIHNKTIRDKALITLIEFDLREESFEEAIDLISNLSDTNKADEFYSQIALNNPLDLIGEEAALKINNPTTQDKILSAVIRAHLARKEIYIPLVLLLPQITKSAEAEILLKEIQSVLLNSPVCLLNDPPIEAIKEAVENCSFKLQLELFETLKHKHLSQIELSSKLQQVIGEIKQKMTCTQRVVDFVRSFPFGFALGHAFFGVLPAANYLVIRTALVEYMVLGLPLTLIPPILVNRALPAEKNDPIQKLRNRNLTLIATSIAAATSSVLPLTVRIIASYLGYHWK